MALDVEYRRLSDLLSLHSSSKKPALKVSHGCTPDKDQYAVQELSLSPGQILVGLEGFQRYYASCDCVYGFGFKVLDIKTGENLTCCCGHARARRPVLASRHHARPAA